MPDIITGIISKSKDAIYITISLIFTSISNKLFYENISTMH